MQNQKSNQQANTGRTDEKNPMPRQTPYAKEQKQGGDDSKSQQNVNRTNETGSGSQSFNQ